MLPKGLFIMKASRIVLVCIAVLILLALIGCGKSSGDGKIEDTTVNDTQTQAAVNNKQPPEYTWEEFEALTDEQQAEYQKSFENIEAFDRWLTEAQAKAILPWKNGGKQPSEYTLEEYEALSDFLQDAFFESFEAQNGFSLWLSKAKGEEIAPWLDGGKQPSEYTWEEYETLSYELQASFQKSFANIEAFDRWLTDAQAKAILPWKNGGKQPSEYTLEEYEALSEFLQDAFFESFDTKDGFSQWMSKASGKAIGPWENGGKQPSEYTWEEYEALSDELQASFQDSFGDIVAFDRWLTEAQAKVVLPWDNGGKQPSNYTLEEYEALSDFLKDAFFESFETETGFRVWMSRAKGEPVNPWDEAGKHPSEYTWEEYEALTDRQQADFQNSFASIEAFDRWLTEAQAKVVVPWKNGGKQPSEYTWAEYEALSGVLKDAFFESFENAAAYEKWVAANKSN